MPKASPPVEGRRRSSRIIPGSQKPSPYLTQERSDDKAGKSGGGEHGGQASKARKRGTDDTPSKSAAVALASASRTNGDEPAITLDCKDERRNDDNRKVSSTTTPGVAAAPPGAEETDMGAGAGDEGSVERETPEAVENSADEADGGAAANGGAAGAPSNNSRREAWAKVARARGAHFARPDRGTASSASARGGNAEEAKESWPGPFAEARRLYKNRDAAAAKREDLRVNGKVAPEVDGSDDDEKERAPAPIKVEWKPRGRGSRSGKSRAVPSLFRLCLDLLAENFDHVESLGYVSAEVRNHLAGVLCRQLKLTTETLQRLSEPGVTELILPDCSRIEPDQMKASLLQCRDTIRVLRLGTCGRCVGDATVSALAAAGGLPRLEMAALAGTYQLTNAGVLKLLECCPKLNGLELPANSRIDGTTLEAMVDSKRPKGYRLKALALSDCFQLDTDELNFLKDMAHLETLALNGVTKLTDGALEKALDACGGQLRHLDISDCNKITDKTIRLLGERCGVIESFRVGMCPLLSSRAIQELFQWSGSAADIAGANNTNPQPSGVGDDATIDIQNNRRIPNGSLSNGDSHSKRKGNVSGAPHGSWKGKGKAKAFDPIDESDQVEDDQYCEASEDDETQKMEPMSVEDTTIATGAISADLHYEVRNTGENKTAVASGESKHKSELNGTDTVEGERGHATLKSRLTTVSLRGLVAVDDGAVTAMAVACSSSLRMLDLNGVALVTDRSMVALARYCSPSLESLDLSFCRGITNDGLGHLVDACPRLTSLRLWGCTQINDRFLKGHSREELVISRY